MNGVTFDSSDALCRELHRRREAIRDLGYAGPRLVLDATPDVPWGSVVEVLDLCKRLGLPLPYFSAPH